MTTEFYYLFSISGEKRTLKERLTHGCISFCVGFIHEQLVIGFNYTWAMFRLVLGYFEIVFERTF